MLRNTCGNEDTKSREHHRSAYLICILRNGGGDACGGFFHKSVEIAEKSELHRKHKRKYSRREPGKKNRYAAETH